MQPRSTNISGVLGAIIGHGGREGNKKHVKETARKESSSPYLLAIRKRKSNDGTDEESSLSTALERKVAQTSGITAGNLEPRVIDVFY
jgi:hypothetical protein